MKPFFFKATLTKTKKKQIKKNNKERKKLNCLTFG